MARNLSSAWLANLSKDDDQTAVAQSILSSQALKRLRDLLDTKIASLTSKTLKEEDFDSPSWALKQAYLNGQLAALKSINDDLLGFLDT